jgi:hypothetical protein
MLSRNWTRGQILLSSERSKDIIEEVFSGAAAPEMVIETEERDDDRGSRPRDTYMKDLVLFAYMAHSDALSNVPCRQDDERLLLFHPPGPLRQWVEQNVDTLPS